jgi:hypothetical protein
MGRSLHLQSGFNLAHEVLCAVTPVDSPSHAYHRQVLCTATQWSHQLMLVVDRCYTL